MRVGLVSCVKSKQSSPAPARELYTSALFRGARRAVETTCEAWFVLSARHGLLDPDTVVEPYDDTLRTASRSRRRRWSREVLEQLRQQLDGLGDHVFELHAGRSYYDHGLASGLQEAGATVVIPTEGLPLGRKLAYYAERRENRAAGASTTAASSRARPVGNAASSGPPGGKYQPLYEHLDSLGSDRGEATFAEIEEILAAPLPASARRHRAWWANDRGGSHAHARAWLAAGFETVEVDLDGERVVFRRTSS